ncbi:MAG: Oxidoreductase FAD-binding domain protein [Friedmanniella sp.]|nr:Oxidoreductase FAD-binding domain protein [Friedmanniella sp.]
MTEGGDAVRPGPGPWRPATVREVWRATPSTVGLRLEVPGRVPHRPGQHYVVRLTAEDGYTASRSYSVASAPDDALLELLVERLPDGEVSSYLAEAVEVGDELEVRGPIGGWFVWDGPGRAVGIGGGTGVVPLVAMLRWARGHPELVPPGRLQLLAAARTAESLPYGAELAAYGARLVLSREASAAGRPAGRVQAEDLVRLVAPDTTYYVCGSAAFAERVSGLLVGLGVEASAVRVERFGPSG